MPRRLNLLAAVLAVAAGCASGALAQADMTPVPSSGTSAPALTIIARSPNAEFRIRGVSVKSMRADDAQNTIAFEFNGPVSDEAFSRLQDELPDWVEMAYAGYDNAVIRARRPVTFMTRTESDGFSMRIVPREGAPGAPPPSLRVADAPPGGSGPPQAHDWHMVQTYFARTAAERPYDAMIRGGYDAFRNGASSVLTVSGEWRHSHGTTVMSSTAHADIEMWSGVHLLGDVHDVVVNAKAVRLSSLLIGPYNKNDLSGSVGVGIPLADDAMATAELLYGRSGLGARLGLAGDFYDWRVGMRVAYHEPYVDTAEAVSLRGERDYSAIYAAGQVFDGLWASGEIRATRYGVHTNDKVATTAGFHAGLRYDISGWPLSLTYDADGEYVLSSMKYFGAPPSPFVPLSITEREVHQFGGSFSDKWDDGFWFDLYGGYAIDRYSNDGPYGGLALRFTPGPGFDVALNGRYSTVADRQGEQGNVLTAGLTLTYAWGDEGAPIMHGGPHSL